jgi:hypothetical protein
MNWVNYWLLIYRILMYVESPVCAGRKQQEISLQYLQVHFWTRPEVREDSGLLGCDVVCLGVVSDVSEYQIV